MPARRLIAVEPYVCHRHFFAIDTLSEWEVQFNMNLEMTKARKSSICSKNGPA